MEVCNIIEAFQQKASQAPKAAAVLDGERRLCREELVAASRRALVSLAGGLLAGGAVRRLRDLPDGSVLADRQRLRLLLVPRFHGFRAET